MPLGFLVQKPQITGKDAHAQETKHLCNTHAHDDESSVITSDGRFGKKKTKRSNSIRFSSTNESIRFNSLLCQNPPRQSTPGVVDSGPEAAGPVHRSHDRLASLQQRCYCLCRSELATLMRMCAEMRSCSSDARS